MNRRLRTVGLISGMAIGMGLATAQFTREVLRNPMVEQPEVVKTHGKAEETLAALRGIREPDLSYAPEHLRESIRAALPYRENLDVLIQKVEGDVKRMEQDPEFATYQTRVRAQQAKISRASNLYAGEIAGIICLTFAGGFMFLKPYKKGEPDENI